MKYPFNMEIKKEETGQDVSHEKANRRLSDKKKKLESALKESEEKYKEFFENAIDPMYINDAEGKILNINRAGIEQLGATSEEIIGTHVSRWFTPESWKLTQETIKKRSLGEPAEDPMIREVVTKSGERKWAEIRSRLIKNGDRVIGYQGIARDITEKIKMQHELKEYQEKLENSYRQLRESEAKYRELFEYAQDTMYVIDTEGVVLKMNQIGLDILGCNKEEVNGSNISKWLTSESLKIFENRRKIICRGEIVNQTDVLELVCKNGEHKWVDIKTRPIKNGDKVTEIHGIARDITENILLKKELNKSNKQRKILCHLIGGTRGGRTRALVLKNLLEKSYNAHQLAKALNKDYKTIRHHLQVLVKNGIVISKSDGNSALYFISKTIESDFAEIDTQHDLNKKEINVMVG